MSEAALRIFVRVEETCSSKHRPSNFASQKTHPFATQTRLFGSRSSFVGPGHTRVRSDSEHRSSDRRRRGTGNDATGLGNIIIPKLRPREVRDPTGLGGPPLERPFGRFSAGVNWRTVRTRMRLGRFGQFVGAGVLFCQTGGAFLVSLHSWSSRGFVPNSPAVTPLSEGASFRGWMVFVSEIPSRPRIIIIPIICHLDCQMRRGSHLED